MNKAHEAAAQKAVSPHEQDSTGNVPYEHYLVDGPVQDATRLQYWALDSAITLASESYK